MMNISEKAKKTIDSCRFCWMCRHVCPIGNATGQERNTARARALGSSLVARGAEEIKVIAANVYECALCGACTNNCVTGWDPKTFIIEERREIILENAAPEYIKALLKKYFETGNIYGKKADGIPETAYCVGEEVLFVAGTDAVVNAPENAVNALALIKKAGERVSFIKNQDSGAALYFLTGKTRETEEAAKRFAEDIKGYKKIVFYDPTDLALVSHEYKEWGIEISGNAVSFNEYLLYLTESGKLKPKKSGKKYSLQDAYSYARDLDDAETGRKLIEKVGENKDMLLCGKEANFAGSLIMNEYMPEVMKKVAENRWRDAINSDCETLVTESPSEYVMLKKTEPEGKRVITVEEMLAENL